MFFYKDILLNNFVNGVLLYDDNNDLWNHYQDPLEEIPFFGIRFIQSLLKSSSFIRNFSKEFYKKNRNAYFDTPISFG
jgi:hypothetical protein